MYHLLIVLVCLITTAGAAAAQFVEDQFIIKMKPHLSKEQSLQFLFRDEVVSADPLVPELNLYLVKVSNGREMTSLMERLQDPDRVEYVQRDHFVSERQLPNDLEFRGQWSLAATHRADIQAERAWDVGVGGRDRRGNRIVVAVVDGGVDTSHPDLIDNLWVNPGEIAGNGVDDDGNGYVDDVHGWNVFNNSGSLPANRHGTHVAGIVGSKGNNSLGTAGVNWDVDILSVAGSSGTTSVVAKAYGYVIRQKQLFLQTGGAKGANIVVTNSSFGVDYGDCSSGEFPIWNDLYNTMGGLGILSAAATANLSIDIDDVGDVPTGCDSDFLVTVTNTTKEDEKYGSAGYGARSVDLGAPGTDILSSLPGGKSGSLTGTSMATPHVAGAVALMHHAASECLNDLFYSDPAEGARQLKGVLLSEVSPLSELQGKTVTGGRLNLGDAVTSAADHRCR